ncbi:acyltransferase family protein [Chitinophaga sp. G-6-1-13]|uniref:Acyltransferase family protein n=1 Tax=Chitinophaga fulva TaxID=2728842 RepID=A0A848GFK9_9BACT|nr:acyltransferase family protein [Chitinophaga fulva]NML37264.1 acyltransferase family protein [Chitinophaga fulva]
MMKAYATYRDTSMDVARGVGILLVVLGHAGVQTSIIYSFHMPLFFMLSGYFWNPEQLFKKILQRKFLTLIVPYFFFFYYGYIFYAVLLSVTGRAGLFEAHAVIPLVYPSMDTPTWFLLALFEVTVLTYVVSKTIRKEVYRLLLVILATILGYYLSRYKLRLPLFLDSAFSMLIFYYAGYQLKISGFLLSYQRRYILPTSILFVVFLVGQFFRNGVDIRSNIIAGSFFPYFITALSGSLLVIVLAYSLPTTFFLWKPLRYLGMQSLLIFGLHFPLLEFARPVASVLTHNIPTLYNICLAFCCLILTLLVAMPCRHLLAV